MEGQDSAFALTQEYEAVYRPNGLASGTTRSVATSRSGRSPRVGKTSAKPLACTTCRRRKVKCHPSSAGQPGEVPCRLCSKVGSQCIIPALDERKLSNSRKLITQLYSRIASLEAELANSRAQCRSCQGNVGEEEEDIAEELVSSPSSLSEGSSGPDNMISRLCGGQRQLNSDRAGRLRFFGPTSSLHLSESVTSSVLIREPNLSRGQYQWQDVMSVDLQNQLLELYWKYQHLVLPIIHKDAFLHDFEAGQTKYCSRLLVHCMLTRAASISDDPEIRALALAEDETNDDPPFLVKKCADLLDAELNNPGITTLQSLQLLSDIYCVICNDTKGWLDAGGACRLVFELGLHSDSNGLGSTGLSQVDLEIRQIAFWSCFSLDRQWALYLGRPQMIKEDDVTVQRPDVTNINSPELKMATVWANLVEIVGIICDALNGVKTTRHRVASLDKKLRDWNASLDSSLQYHCGQSPSAFLLHMQYSSATILLHRPLASFGVSPGTSAPARKISRDLCVHHACLIAQYIQSYQDHHGSVLTMFWIALHMIATATTTLIANLSEDQTENGQERQLACLHTCTKALAELEKSHVPTRRVRRVIQQALRILHLDAEVSAAKTLREMTSHSHENVTEKTILPLETNGGDGGLWDSTYPGLTGDLSMDSPSSWAFFDEFLPAGSQTNMLHSFDSFVFQEFQG